MVDASSPYSDIVLDETYSYVEPKQLLEKEVISTVSIYSDVASLATASSKPPLSPKPNISDSPPSIPKKQEKEQSPKIVRKTSKKILNERKEEEQLMGKSSDKQTHQADNYLNLFLGDRYVNVDAPLQQEHENVPPPKPPLVRVPSGKNTVQTEPSGPAFIKSSPGPSRKNAFHANKQNNTQPQAAGKFVSSITVGTGGQATSMVSSGSGQGTGSDGKARDRASSDDRNKKIPDLPKQKLPDRDIYSLASNVKDEETNKFENLGPMFKQSAGGDVYAQINKASGNLNSPSNTGYSEVKNQNLVNPATQNKGGDSVYESIGTNGEYRPKTIGSKGVYEDIPTTNMDGFYSRK
ncbi:hypothetical protein KUTeg_021267 [Tegillarca granosa]|uniref:Uncharacterized protein n=1 Tax=Tegillarca granosa TaxID=220873 RepID=A0ABQ9EFR5_TEGGR|nr:hypothetical protein KUTeg_021267 [Tegillarca granosa]